MNLSGLFIRKPVATSLLMLAIALFGAVAYRTLAVSDLPNVDFPTLLISANLPGVDSMSSTNSVGSTQITLQFNLSRDLDGAALDVQAAITQAAALLPPGMPSPPTFRKANPADQPILFLSLESDTVPPWVLDEYAETTIGQRISTIPGVA